MWPGCDQLLLNEAFRRALPPGDDPFETVMRLDGEVVRAVDGRRTFRLQLGGVHYFAKVHHGMPWRRILRKLLQFRIPVLGAEREWQAIHRLQELGIPTTPPVGYGCRGGMNPAGRRSFVITEDLGRTITLENECLTWPVNPPVLRYRRMLIREVARIARVLHADGMHHRDFYLCHFRLNLNGRIDPRHGTERPRLHLMDLHRMQRHRRLPLRKRVKDIGGLYFSAMDIGLDRRDIYRFLRAYTNKSLRHTLEEDSAFWQRVAERAQWQYRKEHGRPPAREAHA